jgi:hypothetical protein
MSKFFMILAVGLLAAQVAAAAEVRPLPFKTVDKMPDALTMLSPSQVKLAGFLGTRVDANITGRLLKVDEDELLAGFRKRPGVQDWIGEHVGKFLHAATLAWAYSGDEQLKAKIDRVAAELIKCQGVDGYLGTYVPERRWKSWDVWVHKYDMIGLLTYYQYTGNQSALEASKKIGDLLGNTFGPGKRDIITAGEHVGMAATSVLEPIVMLYRLTGEAKYLDFAKYIVGSYDQPNGPKIVKTLLEVKRVDKTANGKAYEMMSNLVGLCELARVTGEKNYLQAAVNAWEDIVANHLYITGSLSQGEHFHAPHDLPNGQKSNVAETCATVTWMQLNAELLRLSGDARYAEELERTMYNHLAAAQRPDGTEWCYFTSLAGSKPFGHSINCCLSSGPRGMAMVPQMACFKYRSEGKDGLAIDLFDLKSAKVELAGQDVHVGADVSSGGLTNGLRLSVVYTIGLASPAVFNLKVRCPSWAEGFKVEVDGDGKAIAGEPGRWVELPAREWHDGARVTTTFAMMSRVIVGDYGNKGFEAFTWGPLVLAYDEGWNPFLPKAAELVITEPPNPKRSTGSTSNFPLALGVDTRNSPDEPQFIAQFTAFADAGRSLGSRYQVWVSTTNHPLSLLMLGEESRSRRGNVRASINDGDPATFVVTFDGKPAEEDWFAVTLDKPTAFSRVVYAHGRSFHDGGWFDASAGRPRIQVQKEKNGPWETVGELKNYPATTATDSKGLKDGQEFELKLDALVSAIAVRVIGRPACGDNPRQAFSSCGELGAYAK